MYVGFHILQFTHSESLSSPSLSAWAALGFFSSPSVLAILITSQATLLLIALHPTAPT